jgi:septal ring factor EnvC (AmiA/AmiB activator)
MATNPVEKKPGKSSALIWIILIVAALGAAAYFYLTMNQEKTLRVKAEENLVQVKKEKQDVESKLRLAQTENEELKTNNDKLSEDNKTLKGQLDQERADKENISAQIAALTKELEETKASLENASKDKAGVASKLEQTLKDYNSLQSELNKLRQEKAELEKKLSAGKSVSLDKIVVKPENKAGQILVVNREYDFIVINLGRNEGMVPGKEVTIYQNDAVIGKAKVEKVYDAMSTCALSADTKKGLLKEGLIVK